MGRFLRRVDLTPDHVVSSPALRAMRTAQIALAALEAEIGIEIDDDLYEGSAERIVSDAPEGCRSLLVVGHEPELVSIIAARTGATIVLPTAGLAVIALETWQGAGSLLALLNPRLLEAT